MLSNIKKFGLFIYPTQKSVISFMVENKIKVARLYLFAYVNESNYQDYGYAAVKQYSNSKSETFKI